MIVDRQMQRGDATTPYKNEIIHSRINLFHELFDLVDNQFRRLEEWANDRKLSAYTETDPYDVDDKADVIDGITDIAEAIDGVKYILENLKVKCRLDGQQRSIYNVRTAVVPVFITVISGEATPVVTKLLHVRR